MKLGAVLFAAVALDALTFAAVAVLPGVLPYEVNPMTRALVGLVGLAGFVAVKITFGGVGALLLVGARRKAVRVFAFAVLLTGLLGAASNLAAIHQLAADEPDIPVYRGPYTPIGTPSERQSSGGIVPGGVPRDDPGAPSPTASARHTAKPTPQGASVSGTASWGAFGGHVVTRLPRGTRITVCGPLRCWSGQSWGYGPATWTGRIADLDRSVFASICGDPSRGLCRVTIVDNFAP